VIGKDDMVGPLDITVADAIRRYPELADLAALRDAGWLFRPIADNDGRPIGLVGYHNRPMYTDALYIFDRCDTKAVRLLADQPGAAGGIVWHYEGLLAAAIHELLALPEPGHRLAPRLIIARSTPLGLP
jgi:hypothetical protein